MAVLGTGFKANAQGEWKVVLDQINALRAEPDKAGELLEKFFNEGFTDETERENIWKEKEGAKTHRQHFDAVISFIESRPKMLPLQWDADLVTIAANKGNSNNKMFKPNQTFTALDKDPKRAFLWSLLKGYDFHYKELFNPAVGYAGFAQSDNDWVLSFGSLKGKAYTMKESDFANRPYDPREDNNPPWNDALNVKQPNIISFVKADGSLDVVWRDMGNPPKVFLTRYSSGGAKVLNMQVPGVDPNQYQLLAGFTEDPDGNIYILRCQDEGDHDKIMQPDPPRNEKGEPDKNWDRPEMMKLTKLDKDGKELWTKNLAKKGNGALGFITPMSPNTQATDPRVPGRDRHSSTSRIGYIVHNGTPIIFAFYGGATEWDAKEKGRHQNAYWRAVDAKTGEPIQDLNGSAMAHSFDSQLLVSDEGIITVERSDSGLLMGNYLNTRRNKLIFHFFYATAAGEGNECFTQLGSLAKASDGYMVALVGNNSEKLWGKSVDEEEHRVEQLRNRNLLVMRIKKGFAQEIDALADKPEEKKTLDDALNSMVKSDFRDGLNLIGRTYLTFYNKDDNYDASRVKMVRMSDGNYIIIWERWTHVLTKDGKGLEDGTYDSTWAIKINQDGDVLKEAVKLSDTVRITRGDEPVLWNGKATFLAGDVVENKMMIYTVDSNLKFTATPMSVN